MGVLKKMKIEWEESNKIRKKLGTSYNEGGYSLIELGEIEYLVKCVEPMEILPNQELWNPLPKDMNCSNYEVSSLGRIKNLSTGVIRDSSNAFSRPHHGYISASLTLDCGKSNNYLVHRLVALSFLENKERKYSVDHINRVRDDNRLINLRWATHQEQSRNQITTPRRSRKVLKYEKIDGELVFLGIFKNSIEAGISVNRAHRSIATACEKFPNSHCAGYLWKYEDERKIDNENWVMKNINSVDIEISNHGRLKRNGKLLHGNFRRYKRFNINGKEYVIHRLVAFAFLDFDLNSELVIDHIDNNPLNNHVSNLQPLTSEDNIRKAHNKPVCQVHMITFEVLNNYESGIAAARANDFQFSKISAACLGVIRCYKGYFWCFESNLKSYLEELIKKRK